MYIYNGVALLYCRTLSFEMVQERDPTNTDSVWNKYTIRVRGFLSDVFEPDSESPGFNEPVFINDTAAVLTKVKAKLESPRKAFSYTIGSTTIVAVGTLADARNGGQAMDAKLGPEPLAASVREVAAGTFMVECGIVCRIVECPDCPQVSASGTQSVLSPVVSLRWSQTETFDQNWFSHLSTSGKLMVRSDLTKSADLFRPLTTPELLNDYQRVSSRYALSPDGLTLDFNYEDVEVDRLPPSPATKATGRFTVVVEKNCKRVGQCDVHLEGAKGIDRRQLMIRAIAMCYSKFEMETFLTADPKDVKKIKNPIMWGTFREDLFAPAVDVSMQAMLIPVNTVGGGFLTGTLENKAGEMVPVAFRGVGQPPPGCAPNRKAISPPDRKRIAALLVSAFRDPCLCIYPPQKLDTPDSPQSTTKGLAAISPTASVPAEITITPSPGQQPFPLITGPVVSIKPTDSAPYDTYQIETTTVYETGFRQMPGTGYGDNGSVASAVKVDGGAMTMVVTWVAGRTGDPPVLPAFYVPTNTNLIPLSGSIVDSGAVMSAGSTEMVFMTSGFYKYAILDPSLYELSSFVPPFMTQPLQESAKTANVNYSPIFAFQGIDGSNPFIPDGYTASASVSPSEDPIFEEIGDFGDGGDFDTDISESVSPPTVPVVNP